MKKNFLVIAGVVIILAVFFFIAWKQGIWTPPGEIRVTSTGGHPPVSEAGKCWSEDKWYNDQDNYTKDNGCTVCVCNGSVHTVFCVVNTERPDCVTKATK